MRVGAPVEHGGLSRNAICTVVDVVVDRNYLRVLTTGQLGLRDQLFGGVPRGISVARRADWE